MDSLVPLTTGSLEREYGIPAWLLRRLAAKGVIPQPVRAGMVRCWTADQLPAILAAAKERGYPREESK